jgi:glycosyltransferase 2 family protein
VKGFNWPRIARFVICILLLAWISHSIFQQEARFALGSQWDSLSSQERWKAAWTIGPHELRHALTHVGWSAFGWSLLCMGLSLVLGAMRWKVTLEALGLSLPITRVFEISWVAHFFNSFLLGSSGGDLLKAWYAARETHHLKTEAVVAVGLDRLIGLFAMLMFAAGFIFINQNLLWSDGKLQAISTFILVMALGCGSVTLAALWGGPKRWRPAWQKKLRQIPKGQMIERVINACGSLGKRPAALMKCVVLSLWINLVCVLQIAALIRGFDISPPMIPLMAIVPTIICISAIPVTPSGLGVRENLYVLMLASPGLGIPATTALSVSLLAYAGSLIWSALGGLVYLTFRDKHHLKELTDSDIATQETQENQST